MVRGAGGARAGTHLTDFLFLSEIACTARGNVAGAFWRGRVLCSGHLEIINRRPGCVAARGIWREAWRAMSASPILFSEINFRN
jgi:hypothetical protein